MNAPRKLTKGAKILFVHYGDNWLRGSEYCLISTVRSLKASGYIPVVWCNSDILYQTLTDECIEAHCSPMNILLGYHKPKINMKSWLSQIFVGAKLIKKYQPAIVHVNSGAPAQWMNIACAMTRTPSVVQLHAHYGLRRDRITLGLHFCSTIIGVSHAAIRAFKDDRIDNSRLHILPNAIDQNRLMGQTPVALKSELTLNKTDLLLLSIGSLIARKGHRFLLETISQLRTSGIAVNVAIIGDGPERDDLIAYCKRLEIEQFVFFLGERDDAFGIMRGDADALVSTSEDEVFGLVLAEAHLAKLPVIAPNIVGINSVVIHKKTGWLYKPNSFASLSKAIINVADTAAIKRAHKAYWRTSQLYSIEAHTKKLLEIYEHSIGFTPRAKILHAVAIAIHYCSIKTGQKITQLTRQNKRLSRIRAHA